MFENAKREYEKLIKARNEYSRIVEERTNLKERYRNAGKGYNEYLLHNDVLYKEELRQAQVSKFRENNYLYTLIQESKPILQKVFDKYIGKRIGEKTKQKIQDELKEYGLGVYWYCEYSDTFKFTVYYIEDCILEFDLIPSKGIYDENGKLKQLDFENMYCYQVKEYVENIEERMEELERLEEEIKQKEKELNEIIKSHSNLCVSGLKTYNTIYLNTTRK